MDTAFYELLLSRTEVPERVTIRMYDNVSELLCLQVLTPHLLATTCKYGGIVLQNIAELWGVPPAAERFS